MKKIDMGPYYLFASDDLDDFIWNDDVKNYERRPKKTEELQWPYGVKCECGVATLGYTTGHSDWCPLRILEKKDE